MDDKAGRVGAVLRNRGQTLAVAESLTGGLLASAFARAAAASDWFQGGVIAYASSVKHDLLGVPPGPVVSPAAAAAMARGAASVLKATVAVAVTGVGGPGSQDGQPPGTVWVGTWPAELGDPVWLQLDGSPESICQQACSQAAHLLLERLGDSNELRPRCSG